MEEKIKNWIKETLGIDNPVLTHPKNLENGDYTFISLPEKAEEYFEKLKANKLEGLENIEIAGRFINFHLSRKYFAESIEEILNTKKLGGNNILEGKKIMVEYTDPNPFKPFHIGHLMTNAIGESIARILEHSGAEVKRANYQGDVGLHVARAIWGLMEHPELQDKIGDHNLQAENIGKAYALGAQAYEADTVAKEKIDEINKKIYDESDAQVNEIYDWGFTATMQAFEDLYKDLGTQFDFYFLESEVAEVGIEMVKGNVGKVFQESDGAIVFKGEEYDKKLHTRVFITSKGLPAYETKELGLTMEKFETYIGMNLSLVVTANEQLEYMRVVSKALSLMHPEYENKMRHITHGMMRFAEGKMSSRKGNVITGVTLIEDTKALVKEKMADREFDEFDKEKIITEVAVAAIKYSILKQSTGGDIMYDFDKSISFEGDSGPYLQYSFARASSVLRKAQAENILPDFAHLPDETFEVEKMLYRLPEIVRRSSEEYKPHHIANYLIEVARAYNSFYGNNTIVDKADKNSAYKIALTYAFSFVMKTGLHLLGIAQPEKM